MHCPACGHEFIEQNIDQVTLHVCDNGCGGVWLSWHDLSKFNEPIEPAQTPLMIHKSENCIFSTSPQYGCPHCTNIMMIRRYVRVLDEVVIDECPSCGGIWVNGDDLDDIFNQFELDLKEWSDPREDDPKSDDTIHRNQRFTNACRFLWSSYGLTQTK